MDGAVLIKEVVTGLAPVASASLVERVADRIVQAIGEGRIKSGDRLVETELAEQLDISRVPVREALRILQSQGVVHMLPRRGARVIALDEAWASELCKSRVAIEFLCAERAAPLLRAGGEALAKFDKQLALLDESARRQDRAAVNRADLALHSVLFDIADSPVLKSLWAALARHVLVMFIMETGPTRNLDAVTGQHLVLRHMLLSGSPDEIAREISLHVAGTSSAEVAAGRAGQKPVGKRNDGHTVQIKNEGDAP